MATRQGKLGPKPPTEQRHRIARVAFMSVTDQVKAELAAGWSARAIYARLGKKLGGKISYPQFARYARQIRLDMSPLGHAAPPVATSPARAATPPPAAPFTGSTAVR